MNRSASNRLALESSPYLLQHASNPVDWYPWGREALDRAVTEDKPIFLSIGYSACHWCHVMEHESFEDTTIAGILNDNFVCIKVDREERPDLDQLYMNAVMALRQGQGGWPLSAFLTPQQEVFFGGTYWPPKARMGMPGFDHVLHGVLDAFVNRREQVVEQSQQITRWLKQSNSDPGAESSGSQIPSRKTLIDAAIGLHRVFDFHNGGFGGAPKFPHTMDLSLLLRLAVNWPPHQAPGEEELLKMVQLSLKKMAYGGIFDHLAGGFARYSVDEQWLVPHFEKMLYDNALLAGVYLDMFVAGGDPFNAGIARKTLDYLVRYMTDPAGGFHSAEDADSEGVEGRFYVWSKDEIIDALGAETGARFCDLYNVTEHGNFEDANILHMRKSYQQFADLHGIDKQSLREEMRAARSQLLEIRDRRVRPAKDDKVLVSWNALAISALARAAMLLNDDRYATAATHAANFVLTSMHRDDGRLLHSWRQGVARHDAFLDDYAFLIVALVDLYCLDFDPSWIEHASKLAEHLIEHFDDGGRGFFFTADDQEQLIARSTTWQDNSIPSGNAMAALGLLRLGRLTGNTDWIERSHAVIRSASGLLERSPMAAAQLLIALEESLADSTELVFSGGDQQQRDQVVQLFRNISRQGYCLILPTNESAGPPGRLSPAVAGKVAIHGQPTLYVCSGFQCRQPMIGMEAINATLKQLAVSDFELDRRP